MKTCTKCGQSFPAISEHFYRKCDTKDGFQSHCKTCAKVQMHKDYAKHREKRIANQKDYYRIPENKERLLEYARQYRNDPANREKIRKGRQRYQSDPENKKQAAIYQREYRKEYKKRDYVKAKVREYIKTPHAKELRRKHGHLWRARKLNATGDYNVRDFEHMLELVDHRCVKCHKKKPLAADHIIPLTQNGCNCIHNLQPLCASCNSKKRNLDFSDYRPLIVHKWLSTIPHKHSS